MNYFDDTLLVLDRIKKNDDNMVACFVFGSFVTKETSLKNYKEIRVFDGPDFILSKFNLVNIYPDMDILCVSNDVDQTSELFNKTITDVFGHFVTVNVVSKKVFENELFSDQPTAIKRIFLYSEILVVKGNEYIQKLKDEVVKIERPIDKYFQEEFNFRKEYLKLFAKYNISTMVVNKYDYEKLFPHVLKFIIGDLHAGFPAVRTKLVYPRPMELKAQVDLSNVELEDLI